MYDDVPEVLRALHASGLKIGLISNSHRCLDVVPDAISISRGCSRSTMSSLEHGYMKPHPQHLRGGAARGRRRGREAVMVGDSLTHDVEGARRLGMRGVLVSRSGRVPPLPARRSGYPVAPRIACAPVAASDCAHADPPAHHARRVPRGRRARESWSGATPTPRTWSRRRS